MDTIQLISPNLQKISATFPLSQKWNHPHFRLIKKSILKRNLHKQMETEMLWAKAQRCRKIQWSLQKIWMMRIWRNVDPRQRGRKFYWWPFWSLLHLRRRWNRQGKTKLPSPGRNADQQMKKQLPYFSNSVKAILRLVSCRRLAFWGSQLALNWFELPRFWLIYRKFPEISFKNMQVTIKFL